MSTDITRHFELFDPLNFSSPDDKIDIIGAGATGSKVALELMKLGIKGKQLRVWDFDRVEAHNIANQVYGLEDVGKYKVDALADIIYAQTGEEIEIQRKAFKQDSVEQLAKYVLILTDTMSSRRELWESKIKSAGRPIALIETRMGVDCTMTFTLWNNDQHAVDRYEDNFYEDGEAEVSSCGTTLSVGPTSSMLASIATWQFMKLAKAGVRLKDSLVEFRILLNSNPFSLYSL